MQVRPADFVLAFTLSEEEAVQRLVKRGETSGRADDNEDTIRSRMQVFNAESQPVIDALKETGRVAEIDSAPPVDDVYQAVRKVVAGIDGVELPAAPAAEPAPVEEEKAVAPPAPAPPPAGITHEKLMMMAARVSAVLVISGPSGVGKGTLIQRLMAEHSDKFGFTISHTTRKPRPGEEDGVHYHFTSQVRASVARASCTAERVCLDAVTVALGLT